MRTGGVVTALCCVYHTIEVEKEVLLGHHDDLDGGGMDAPCTLQTGDALAA